MGKGGGAAPQQQQPQTSQVTQTTSNLPEYAEPFFTRLLERTEAQTRLPYDPFPDRRIADPTAAGTASEELIREIATDPTTGQSFDVAGLEFVDQIGRPTQFTGTALAEEFDPSSTYERYAAPTEDVLRSADPRTNVASFINPFLENVLLRQEASATRRFDEAKAGRDAEAIGANAFRGSRRFVPEALARRDLDERLDDIGATSRAKAFDTALAAATGQQELALKTRAQAMADAAAQQQRRASLAETADRLGLAGAEALLQAAPGKQRARLEQASALAGLGETERLRTQSELDLAYQDFINQRDYERGQLQYLSSILRGVPITAESEVRRSEPPPSPYAPLLSLGLGAAGLSKLLG
tara:strand:+ start:1522 stop:2589 length:1068 start_codon:yes stop_codon:yes gene_type:complete